MHDAVIFFFTFSFLERGMIPSVSDRLTSAPVSSKSSTMLSYPFSQALKRDVSFALLRLADSQQRQCSIKAAQYSHLPIHKL